MYQVKSLRNYKSESIFISLCFERSIFSQKYFPYKYLFCYLYFKSLNDEKQQKIMEKKIEKIFGLDIETFQEYCLQGENESYIAHLIRQDVLNEFIIKFVENSNNSIVIPIRTRDEGMTMLTKDEFEN